MREFGITILVLFVFWLGASGLFHHINCDTNFWTKQRRIKSEEKIVPNLEINVTEDGIDTVYVYIK